MDSSFTNAYPHSWESPAVQWLTPCPVNASGHSPRFSVHGQNISTKQNSFQNSSLGPDASWSGRQYKSCLMNMEQGKGRRECWGAPGIHQALRAALRAQHTRTANIHGSSGLGAIPGEKWTLWKGKFSVSQICCLRAHSELGTRKRGMPGARTRIPEMFPLLFGAAGCWPCLWAVH